MFTIFRGKQKLHWLSVTSCASCLILIEYLSRAPFTKAHGIGWANFVQICLNIEGLHEQVTPVPLPLHAVKLTTSDMWSAVLVVSLGLDTSCKKGAKKKKKRNLVISMPEENVS